MKMGHYDSCREGYCGKCGAAPGNFIDGACMFCYPVANRKKKAKATIDPSKVKKTVTIYKEPTYDILLEMAYQANLIPRGHIQDITLWIPILKGYYIAAVKAGTIKKEDR